MVVVVVVGVRVPGVFPDRVDKLGVGRAGSGRSRVVRVARETVAALARVAPGARPGVAGDERVGVAGGERLGSLMAEGRVGRGAGHAVPGVVLVHGVVVVVAGVVLWEGRGGGGAGEEEDGVGVVGVGGHKVSSSSILPPAIPF